MVYAGEDRSIRLVDLIVIPNTDRRLILAVINVSSRYDGSLEDIVNRSQTHVMVIKQGLEEFNNAPKGAMTVQDQRTAPTAR